MQTFRYNIVRTDAQQGILLHIGQTTVHLVTGHDHHALYRPVAPQRFEEIIDSGGGRCKCGEMQTLGGGDDRLSDEIKIGFDVELVQRALEDSVVPGPATSNG